MRRANDKVVMTLLKFVAVGVLAAAVGAAWVQKNSIAQLRQTNAGLRHQAIQAEELAGRNRSGQQSDNPEIKALTEATGELPKLRNEVRQLRQQKPELERLRNENGRLAAQISSSANRPKLADMEGYVPKEKWTRAGFATPETTVQSFFWAIANQDVSYIVQCMAPKMKAQFDRQFAGKSVEEQQKELAEGMAAFGRMGGYRIAETERISENKVRLGIEAAAGGHIMKLPLERIDNEWKLNEPK
jgi:hypothetical protein